MRNWNLEIRHWIPPWRILLLALLSLFNVHFSAQAQVTFRTLTSVNVPDEPYELAKGDFNNDGRTDLVTANYTGLANQQVTVLLNTGSGTFTGGSLRNFAAPTFPIDVAVGDFNEDGQLDVVACSTNNNNFSLLLGDGAGNLAAPVNIATGNSPLGIAVGDMNKDNNLDVLVSHSGTPDDIYIYLGNGAGGFAAPAILSNPANTTWDITVADFNLDTNPDFAITTAGVYTVQIWTGNGSGTSFTVTQTIASLAINPDLDARDLNGDGAMDIIVAPGYIMNNGTGTFGARVILSQSDEEYTTGDLNNDGNIDIVTTDNNTNRANSRVYLGNGAGAFTLLNKTEMNVYARGLELVDVNNDGNLDVIGAGGVSSDGRVDILLGDGTGYFTNSITKYPVPTDPRDLITGDFNEDGQIDVALCHSIGNIMTIYLGGGGGKFTKTATNYATGNFPADLITFDYNKDGHLDLAVFNQTGASITVFTGAGDGSFSLLTSFSVVSAAGSQLASADINNDTFPDLLVSGATNNQVNVYPGTGTGFGSGISSPLSNNVQYIGVADFTGDGKLDLVAYFNNIFRMVLLTGTGSGTFTEGATQYPMAGANLLVTDINGDAITDVITFSNSGTGSDYFINDGTGTFTGSTIPASLGGQAYAYTDMNGDGLKDLVVGAQNPISSESGQIVVFRGTGTGIASTVYIDHDNSGGNRAAVHDVNGDGKMDVITTSFNTSEDYLGTLINTSTAVGCPSITTQPVSQNVCEGQNAMFTIAASGNPTLTYQWFKGAAPVAGGTSATLNISGVTTAEAGTYSCTVSNGCGSATTSTVTLNVNALPSAPVTTPGSSCGSGTVSLVAAGGVNGQYRWYTTSTGGTALAGETNDTYVTPVLSVTTTYYVAIHNGTCEGNRSPVSANILTIPSPPGSTPGLGCSPSSAVMVTASGGTNGQYRWYTASTGGIPIAGEVNSTYTTPALSASTTYYISIHDGTCESTRTSVLAEIRSCTPTITTASATINAGGQTTINIVPLVTTINNPLDVSSIKVVQQPTSGATASVTAGVLLIDYTGVPFAGTDQLTIEACDLAANCAQEVITVDVVGEITVYNAVSPNGDGLNDVLFIQYVDAIPTTTDNKVTIFNRWGSVVFEVENYDNVNRVFRGVNSNGTELPTGTYYYTIEFVNEPKRTGFISLKR